MKSYYEFNYAQEAGLGSTFLKMAKTSQKQEAGLGSNLLKIVKTSQKVYDPKFILYFLYFK